MGKQLNYCMTYEAFLQLAQTALDAGCMIVRKVYTEKEPVPSSDLSCITPDCCQYWFYLPELAEMVSEKSNNGLYYPDYGYNALGLAMIEAGFSRFPSDRARLYVMTGFYDDAGSWIARSERITKIYEKLARKARKLAGKVL